MKPAQYRIITRGIICATAFVLLILWTLVGCKKTEQPEVQREINVSAISVSPSEVTLIEGDLKKLSCTLSPSNASNKHVEWISANKQVATVNEGVVQALTIGKTIIIARSHNGLEATSEVTVVPKTIDVTELHLSPSNITLTTGEEAVLTVTLLPDNASNKTVIWSSSAQRVASVQQGRVVANSAGSATITATSHNGKSATCIVKVQDNDGLSIPEVPRMDL